MEYDINSLKEFGIDPDTGIAYTGSMDKFISALQRFYMSYEKNRAKVEATLAEADLENYMITVHSLKSNAKMIGAVDLSSRFEALETASRASDMDAVRGATPDALNSYELLIKALKPIGSAEKVSAADEISADEARKTANELLDALDDFDDELSAALATKLSGYPFRMTQRGLLKQASEYIGSFMYDEAADIIRQITDAIE